jgi:hypothetical protein
MPSPPGCRTSTFTRDGHAELPPNRLVAGDLVRPEAVGRALGLCEPEAARAGHVAEQVGDLGVVVVVDRLDEGDLALQEDAGESLRLHRVVRAVALLDE